MPIDPNEAPDGYVAVVSNDGRCEGCALSPHGSDSCLAVADACCHWQRDDGQDVIFVKRPEAQAAPAAVAERGVEGTGLTEAEFAQYVQQRKDFNAAPAAAQPVAQHPTLLQCVREMLEFQSAKEGPSIHDWGRWRRAADAADTTPPALVGLSERQVVAALVESGCIGTVRMSYDSGPYEITRTSINADRFAKAIQRALAAANGMTLREGGNG